MLTVYLSKMTVYSVLQLLSSEDGRFPALLQLLVVSRCFRVVVNDPLETGTVLTCTHKVKQGHKIPDIETSAKPINLYKCDKDVVFKQKIS